MHIPSLVKIHWCLLKLSSGNEKRTDRRTDVWRLARHTDIQRETIIPRHYCVAGYKNQCHGRTDNVKTVYSAPPPPPNHPHTHTQRLRGGIKISRMAKFENLWWNITARVMGPWPPFCHYTFLTSESKCGICFIEVGPQKIKVIEQNAF